MTELDGLFSGLSLNPLSASSSESADCQSALGLDPRYTHYRSLRDHSRPSQRQKMLEQWIESQARTRAGRLQSLRGQADNKIVGLPSSGPSEVEMLIKTNDLLVGDVLVDFETKSRKALSMIKTDDPIQQLAGAIYFRKCLSVETKPPIDAIVKMGLLPIFVKLLAAEGSADNLRFETAWALTNVASGTTEQCKAMVQCGGAEAFCNIVKAAGSSERLVEQAVWGLGNIAGDGHPLRDLLNKMGLIPALVKWFPSLTSLSAVRNLAWTVSNLCRGKPQPALKVVLPALPLLTGLVCSADDEVVTDSLWAFSYISDGTNDNIDAVLSSGCLERIVTLLDHPSPGVVTPALRTIGNLVTGDDSQTEMVLSTKFLAKAKALLGTERKGIRKEMIWTLSNITAGTVGQIQAVIDQGIIPTLIALAKVSPDTDILKETIWVLSNFLSGGSLQQIDYILNQGLIEAFASMLSHNIHPNALKAALDGISAMLRKAPQHATLLNPLLDLLVEWETHNSSGLSEAAGNLLALIDAGDRDH